MPRLPLLRSCIPGTVCRHGAAHDDEADVSPADASPSPSPTPDLQSPKELLRAAYYPSPPSRPIPDLPFPEEILDEIASYLLPIHMPANHSEEMKHVLGMRLVSRSFRKIGTDALCANLKSLFISPNKESIRKFKEVCQDRTFGGSIDQVVVVCDGFDPPFPPVPTADGGHVAPPQPQESIQELRDPDSRRNAVTETGLDMILSRNRGTSLDDYLRSESFNQHVEQSLREMVDAMRIFVQSILPEPRKICLQLKSADPNKQVGFNIRSPRGSLAGISAEQQKKVASKSLGILLDQVGNEFFSSMHLTVRGVSTTLREHPTDTRLCLSSLLQGRHQVSIELLTIDNYCSDGYRKPGILIRNLGTASTLTDLCLAGSCLAGSSLYYWRHEDISWLVRNDPGSRFGWPRLKKVRFEKMLLDTSTIEDFLLRSDPALEKVELIDIHLAQSTRPVVISGLHMNAWLDLDTWLDLLDSLKTVVQTARRQVDISLLPLERPFLMRLLLSILGVEDGVSVTKKEFMDVLRDFVNTDLPPGLGSPGYSIFDARIERLRKRRFKDLKIYLPQITFGRGYDELIDRIAQELPEIEEAQAWARARARLQASGYPNSRV